MAPKKDAAPPAAADEAPAEEPQEKEIVVQMEGAFLLSNGSSYKGQYNVIRKASADTINAEVAGTALEPLVDKDDNPVVPTVEKDADFVPRRKGGALESEKREIHGYGKLLFGPELFDGEWRHGQMIKGKHVFASGAVYEGFFSAGQMHGEGVYRSFTSTATAAFEGVSVH